MSVLIWAELSKYIRYNKWIIIILGAEMVPPSNIFCEKNIGETSAKPVSPSLYITVASYNELLMLFTLYI